MRNEKWEMRMIMIMGGGGGTERQTETDRDRPSKSGDEKPGKHAKRAITAAFV